MRLPLVDAQLMRRRVSAGLLQFRSVLQGPSAWVGLDQVETDAGQCFDERSCRVWLQGADDFPWQSLPEIRALVSMADGSPTSLSITMRELHSSLVQAYPNPDQHVADLSKGLSSALMLQALKSQKSMRGCGGSHNAFEYAPQSMLNAVRLSDEVKDLSRMKDVAMQVFKMLLSNELASHLITQDRWQFNLWFKFQIVQRSKFKQTISSQHLYLSHLPCSWLLFIIVWLLHFRLVVLRLWL